MVGLSDEVLKRHVYQMCNSISSVDALRAICSTFEAARKDAFGGNSWRENPSTAGAHSEEGPPDIAVARQHPAARPDVRQNVPVKAPAYRTCGNCGGDHAPGRELCPAKATVCFGCQKVGHLKKCCRSLKRQTNAAGNTTATSEVSGAVAIAATHVSVQPTLEISVAHAGGEGGLSLVVAVADTGAQVCVAGPSVMSALNIQPTQLKRQAGLRDVANIHLKCMGSAPCIVKGGGRSTLQEVYFVHSAKNFYLSLDACKDLGLVHRNFPIYVASATTKGEGVVHSENIPMARPTKLPFSPLIENVPRLEEWLRRHFSFSTFNTNRTPLPTMAGKPHHIHLMADAVPYACHTPASVPRHWEDEVKAQLNEDVRRGVLQAVPAGEATEWCARMVVVPKKNSQPRRTVDYQRLNAQCLRETHHTPVPFDMVSGVPLHSYKTVADAFWGFHQVELDEESRRLTTFITPWGRYQYCRTPMGHCSASDAYTRRFDDAIKDISRRFKCVDDVLLYDSNIEEAFWHAYEFLETCAEKGITLQPEKFKFCRKEVEFVGYCLGWDMYKPTDDRVAAIKHFAMPAKPTISDIRSWYGFVNQLAPFLITAPIMEPFRELLKKHTGKQVYWDELLERRFKLAQDTICQMAKDGLAYYDKTRPTIAMTDWSKEGIGFVVLQQYCSCSSTDPPFCCRGGWRLALCGSRCLTTAEAGYAAVEGETLAVVWCLQKARLFLLGCPSLIVVTDHRPLVKLLGDRALKDIANPRLFRLKEKTLQFKFQLKYLPGKKNCAADFLSRYPALKAPPDGEDNELEEELSVATAAATVAILEEESYTLDEETVRRAAEDDPVYQLLLAKVIADDWHPQKSQEIACIRPFYGVRDRLAVAQDLITYTFEQGSIRLVIPECLRLQVAANLHAGHQGLDSMLRRARQSVYWPGMEGDLQNQRSSCPSCETHAPSQPAEALVITPPPDYPFQQTVVDMFQSEGHMYMAYADRLTGWLEVAHFPNGTESSRIKKQLRRYFTRWGVPEKISMDGGTNLVSEEMNEFYKKWGVKVRISSAHYPQSNGRAEVAVKTAKRIIRDNTGSGGSLDSDKTTIAILQYLNTPLRDVNKSPAQLASGRQLRDSVPIARQHFKVDSHWGQTLRRRERQMAQHQDSVASKGTDRGLNPLPLGTLVRVQNQASNLWDRSGVITEIHPNRQYIIRLDGSGRLSLRNRRHLRVSGTPLVAPHGQTAPPQPPTMLPGTGTRPPKQAMPETSRPSRPTRDRTQPKWLSDYVQGTP